MSSMENESEVEFQALTKEKEKYKECMVKVEIQDDVIYGHHELRADEVEVTLYVPGDVSLESAKEIFHGKTCLAMISNQKITFKDNQVKIEKKKGKHPCDLTARNLFSWVVGFYVSSMVILGVLLAIQWTEQNKCILAMSSNYALLFTIYPLVIGMAMIGGYGVMICVQVSVNSLTRCLCKCSGKRHGPTTNTFVSKVLV